MGVLIAHCFECAIFILLTHLHWVGVGRNDVLAQRMGWMMKHDNLVLRLLKFRTVEFLLQPSVLSAAVGNWLKDMLPVPPRLWAIQVLLSLAELSFRVCLNSPRSPNICDVKYYQAHVAKSYGIVLFPTLTTLRESKNLFIGVSIERIVFQPGLAISRTFNWQ